MVSPLSHAQAFYDDEICRKLKHLPTLPKIKGFLATDDPSAHIYARFMRKAFGKYGIDFELYKVAAEDLLDWIEATNKDSDTDGIFIFYPVFGGEKDRLLRNTVAAEKDIEGLSDYWLSRLYLNDRFVGKQKKALLPCTPLAVVKILEQCLAWNRQKPFPLQGKRVTIFNRSEVVGRPLAGMLSNDGAEIFSFDIDSVKLFRYGEAFEIDIDRTTALKQSDIVITGVPSERFERISAREIKQGAVCVNFSSVPNFSEDITEAASVFVPRLGPITVLMCVRNALRLHKNFYAKKPS